MPVTSKIIHYPKFSYGQLSEGHTLMTTLPPNKYLVYTPPLNRNPNEYLSAGCTAVNVNGGVPFGNFNIPPAQRGVCGNTDFIKAYGQGQLGNKPLANWTEAECRACAQSALSDTRQMHRWWTSQAGEAYGDNIPFALVDGSNQKRWIESEFAARLATQGHHYFSQYRGHVLTRSFTEDFNNTEILRPGFSDNAQALQLCRQSTADDFLYDAYQYRDGLVTSYYSGQIDPRKFMGGHLTDCVLEKKARTQLGSVALNRIILGFGWYGEYQTMDPDVWHVTYKTPVPAGGYTLHTRPPRYAFPVQVGLALTDFALLDGVFGWESTLMYGENPNVIYPDFQDIGGAGKYYGSANPAQAQGVSYYQSGVTAGYAPHPVGYQDAPLVAAKWVSIAHTHSQWGNMVWCRMRPAGSSNWTSNDASYVLDRYQQNQPWALVGGVGSKGWVLMLDYAGNFGEVRDWEIDTPLGIATIRQTSGSGRIHLLN